MTVLRLREDVFILPYDEDDDSQRFVAGVDGRQFVISAGLAVLLEEMRVPATLESIAQRTSDRTGVCITASELELLLRERVPSVLFQADSDPQPFFGPLRLRIQWWSADLISPLLRSVRGLFTWRMAVALMAVFLCVEALVAAQVPAVATHEIAARDTALGIALTLAGMAVHELGHLAACHRFGAWHGGAGVGLYWCFPVFYAEVHGVWMMPALQRAAMHAAGVYFHCTYLAVIGVLHWCFELPALQVAMAWSHLLVLHALNPMFKSDGYWLLADLAGVNDLHRQIRGASRADFALVGAFAAGACAYLTYLLNALAQGLAAGVAATSLAWDAKEGLSTIGIRSAALVACAVLILCIAVVLARALSRVLPEPADDR
jgi:putative peptide zinc metalloprotease protein